MSTSNLANPTNEPSTTFGEIVPCLGLLARASMFMLKLVVLTPDISELQLVLPLL